MSVLRLGVVEKLCFSQDSLEQVIRGNQRLISQRAKVLASVVFSKISAYPFNNGLFQEVQKHSLVLLSYNFGI